MTHATSAPLGWLGLPELRCAFSAYDYYDYYNDDYHNDDRSIKYVDLN